MMPEALAKLSFDERANALELESYIFEHPEEAAMAVVALRSYCFLLERGLGSHEARATVFGEER